MMGHFPGFVEEEQNMGPVPKGVLTALLDGPPRIPFYSRILQVLVSP